MRELSMSERQDHAQSVEELRAKSSQLKSVNSDIQKLKAELTVGKERFCSECYCYCNCKLKTNNPSECRRNY